MLKIKNLFNIKGLVFFLCLILIGLLTITGFIYNEYSKIKRNPDLIAKEEVRSVVSTISKFMDLPKDEQPTLATVTDVSKLDDEKFFKNAQNGDKLLVYTKAGKAILYRPSANRVIEFAPLVIGANQTDAVRQSVKTPVTIYNGSTTAGLTNQVQDRLKSLASIEVVSRENAQKNDYTETLVVDVAGTNSALVSQIANLLGGKVSSMPADENKPESEVLIIAAQ